MPTVVSDDMPSDDVPAFAEETPTVSSTERVCIACGKTFDAGNGRGRKPSKCPDCRTQSSQKVATSSSRRNVSQALSVMDGVYSGLILGMALLLPDAAMAMQANYDQAMRLNRQAFESNKKLADKVTKVGGAGGTIAFVAAQGLMVYPAAVAIARMPRKPKSSKSVKASAQTPESTAPARDMSFFE